MYTYFNYSICISLIIYQLGNLIINGVFGIGTIIALIVLAGMIFLLVRKGKTSEKLEVQYSVH